MGQLLIFLTSCTDCGHNGTVLYPYLQSVLNCLEILTVQNDLYCGVCTRETLKLHIICDVF